jgi:hypothetical protein
LFLFFYVCPEPVLANLRFCGIKWHRIAKKTFHRTTTPSISSELMEPIRKRHSFLSFPYVCPEPVLAKLSFIYINGAKNGVFLPWERENAMLTPCSSGGKKSLYVQLFLVLLRLSRACLGKLFGF